MEVGGKIDLPRYGSSYNPPVRGGAVEGEQQHTTVEGDVLLSRFLSSYVHRLYTGHVRRQVHREVDTAVGSKDNPLILQELSLHFPPPRRQGDASPGVDDPVPGEIMFFR